MADLQGKPIGFDAQMVQVWISCGKASNKPTMTGDGWNPTYKNGDDLGIVYGIGCTTLL